MNATTVAVDRSGAVATLRIAGDVTSASEAELMSGYTHAIEGGAGAIVPHFLGAEDLMPASPHAIEGGAGAIVLDFSGLEYMNSGGIGLLVTLLVRAQRGGV